MADRMIDDDPFVADVYDGQSFYMGFCDQIPLYASLSKAELNVLFACIMLSTFYNDNTLKAPGCEVLSHSAECERIANITKLNVRTVKNTMADLSKAGILLKEKGTRGVYYLNPLLFYKGKLSLRGKLVNKYLKTSWREALLSAQKLNYGNI